MTLLQLVQEFTRRQGLPVPGAVVGNDNPQVQQILSLLMEIGDDLLMERWEWSKRVADFTTIAAEDQGLITAITGTDFLSILNETFWDKTNRRPVYGPQSEAAYQQARVFIQGGTVYRHRIEQGKIFLWPEPVAGVEMTFYWTSNQWVVDGTGAGGSKSAFTDDRDSYWFDDRVMRAGLRYYWLEQKGLDFAVAKKRFDSLVKDALTTGQTFSRLSLDKSGRGYMPGIYVPTGAYNT